MRLVAEGVLGYQGLHGINGLCHVRQYEQPGVMPVVIVGQLDDNPGTSITNEIEMVAASVERVLFPEGREFRMIEHYPEATYASLRPHGSFALVHFTRLNEEERARRTAGRLVLWGEWGTALARRPVMEGDFAACRWERIRDIESYLGCEVKVWYRGDYTARAVAGEEGEQARLQVREKAHAAAQRLRRELEGAEAGA
jgi:hypothetical protein